MFSLSSLYDSVVVVKHNLSDFTHRLTSSTEDRLSQLAGADRSRFDSAHHLGWKDLVDDVVKTDKRYLETLDHTAEGAVTDRRTALRRSALEHLVTTLSTQSDNHHMIVGVSTYAKNLYHEDTAAHASGYFGFLSALAAPCLLDEKTHFSVADDCLHNLYASKHSSQDALLCLDQVLTCRTKPDKKQELAQHILTRTDEFVAQHADFLDMPQYDTLNQTFAGVLSVVARHVPCDFHGQSVHICLENCASRGTAYQLFFGNNLSVCYGGGDTQPISDIRKNTFKKDVVQVTTGQPPAANTIRHAPVLGSALVFTQP